MTAALVALLLSASATQSVEAEGVGRTEEEAKLQALVSAVEQVCGARVKADTVVRGKTLWFDSVATHVNGFVKSFEVLAVEPDAEHDSVKVKLRALVLNDPVALEVARVRDTLRIISSLKLAVAIEEQLPLQPPSKSFSLALREQLTADGWKLGAEPADCVLRGSVDYRYLPEPRPGAFSVTAQLRLTHVSSGVVIAATGAASRFSPSPDDGVAAVVKRVMADLRTSMLDFDRRQKVNGTELELTITGIDLGDLEPLEKALAQVPGVLAVKATDSFENETGRFTVTFRGESPVFARALSSVAYKKRKLAAVSKGPNQVAAGFRSP